MEYHFDYVHPGSTRREVTGYMTSFVAKARGYSSYRSLLTQPQRIHSLQRHLHTLQRHLHIMGTLAARSIFRNGTHSLTRPAITATFASPKLAK